MVEQPAHVSVSVWASTPGVILPTPAMKN